MESTQLAGVLLIIFIVIPVMVLLWGVTVHMFTEKFSQRWFMLYLMTVITVIIIVRVYTHYIP